MGEPGTEMIDNANVSTRLYVAGTFPPRACCKLQIIINDRGAWVLIQSIVEINRLTQETHASYSNRSAEYDGTDGMGRERRGDSRCRGRNSARALASENEMAKR